MASTLIAHAHIVGALHGVADERVDDGALANTACAKQRNGLARCRIAAKRFESDQRDAADRVNGHAKRHGFKRCDRLSNHLWVVDKVEFREHHNRQRTAVKCQHQLALEATLVWLAVEAMHQKDNVDV